MLVFEHLLYVFVLVLFAFLIIVFSALFVQLIDIDHWCVGLGAVDNVKVLLKCAKATSVPEIMEHCQNLRRGVFHNVLWVYFEIFIALVFIGLAFGHGMHLIMDGYNIFGYLGSFVK